MKSRVRGSATSAVAVWLTRLALIGVVLVFMAVAPGRWVSAFTLAPPSAIVDELAERLGDPSFPMLVGVTVYHTIIPLALSAVSGVLSAWLLWSRPRLRRALEGYLAVAYSIPRVIFLPLFILWIGMGSATIILYVTLACYFIFLFNALEGFVTSGRRLVGILEILGLNRRQIFLTYLLPAARPYLLAAVLIAFPTAVLGAIIGEMIVGGGLGGWIMRERGALNVAGLWAATLTASVFAATLNIVVQRVGEAGRRRLATE